MLTERTFVINLDIRRDRLEKFYASLPSDFILGQPERWQAIHGDSVKHPDWWTAGNGAWGCYKSHLNILEYCLNNHIDSYTVFEDDAFFREDFNERMTTFFTHLPSNWGMAYLGGQLLHVEKYTPEIINEYVYRPFNVNRTHAFMVNGSSAMTELYRFLQAVPFEQGYHIDHHLGLLHERKKLFVYCPHQWLVGQNTSTSNISGNTTGATFFDDPYDCVKARQQPFAVGPAKP